MAENYDLTIKTRWLIKYIKVLKDSYKEQGECTVEGYKDYIVKGVAKKGISVKGTTDRDLNEEESKQVMYSMAVHEYNEKYNAYTRGGLKEGKISYNILGMEDIDKRINEELKGCK